MPIIITPINKKKKKDKMGEEKIPAKKNMGINSMMKKKKAQYKYMGGKIDDANYASCGANIMRTK